MKVPIIKLSSAEKEVLSRILVDAAQLVTDISQQLPKFQMEGLREVLDRQDDVMGGVNKILADLKRIRADSDYGDASLADFAEKYRRAVVRALDELELFGAELSPGSKKYKLSIAYLALEVERELVPQTIDFGLEDGEAPDVNSAWFDDFFTGLIDENGLVQDLEPDAITVERMELPKQEEREDRVLATHRADTLLSQLRKLVIRGDAGSGKTTLLQWLAVMVAGKRLDGELATLNDRVPFFVKLRQFSGKDLPVPSAFPGLISSVLVDGTPMEMVRRWVNQVFEAGSALVLIDGLDELPTAQHRLVHDWLADILANFPDTQIIVTARPHVVMSDWNCLEGFDEAVLQPLRSEDLYRFVEHWHAALRADAKNDQDRQTLTDLEQSLKQRFDENSELRELATTPLLAALICALHRDRSKEIPSQRVRLYEACLQMLFRRDRERSISVSDYASFSEDHLTAILADLALWMQRNGKSEVSVADTDRRLEIALRKLHGQRPTETSEGVRKLLTQRINVLRTPDDETIDFPHRTFQEYLAAIGAVEDDAVEELVRHAHEEQWRETVILAAGVLRGGARAEKLIQSLLDRGDTDIANQPILYITASSAMQLITSTTPESRIAKDVEKRLKTILPPKNKAQAAELAKAGKIVVPHLKHRPELRATQAASSIRTLALIGGEQACKVLGKYGVDNRRTVTDEIHRSLNFTGDRQAYFSQAFKHLWWVEITGKTWPNVISTEIFSPSLAYLSVQDYTGTLDLSSQKKLEFIFTRHCPQLRIMGLCRNIQKISAINSEIHVHTNSKLSGLSEIGLFACGGNLTDALIGATSLKKLALSGLQTRAIPQLSSQKTLEEVTLRRVLIEDLSPLEGFNSIGKMDLSTPIKTFRNIPPLHGLSSLTVDKCQLTDLDGIENFTALRYFKVTDSLYSLTGMERLRFLESVELGAENTISLSPLSTLLKLNYINVPHTREWVEEINSWARGCDRAVISFKVELNRLRVELSGPGERRDFDSLWIPLDVDD